MKVSAKAIILLVALLILSPIFGVILADAVGYHEPLDVAAEYLGLQDISEEINWTPFLDYSVPGMPATLGYVISGILGIIIIMIIGLIMRTFIGDGERQAIS
jgi:cobalt/nickel transport protein